MNDLERIKQIEDKLGIKLNRVSLNNFESVYWHYGRSGEGMETFKGNKSGERNFFFEKSNSKRRIANNQIKRN